MGGVHEFRPCADELFGVLLDLRRQPVGARLGSDEAEDGGRRQCCASPVSLFTISISRK